MNPTNINTPDSTNQEISLKDLLIKLKELYRYLLSKWIIIVMFTLIGAALGFTYALFEKTVYQASSTFVLEEGESSGGMGQYAGIASVVGIDLGAGGGGVFQGDNIMELYRSRKMIKNALLSPTTDNPKKMLIDLYMSFNPSLNNTGEKIDFHLNSDQPFSRKQDSLLNIVVKDINQNHLSVSKPDKKLSIIKVDVRASSEVFAKDFNDEIVKKVNDFYVTTKTKKSQQNVNILQHKTDSVRAVMNGAIYTAVAVSDATPNLNPTRQIQRAAPAQKAQFSAETNRTVLGELVKNLEMTKMALLKESPLIQIIDQPVFPLEKEIFGKIKGLMMGGFLFGFITVFFLIFKKLIGDVIK